MEFQARVAGWGSWGMSTKPWDLPMLRDWEGGRGASEGDWEGAAGGGRRRPRGMVCSRSQVAPSLFCFFFSIFIKETNQHTLRMTSILWNPFEDPYFVLCLWVAEFCTRSTCYNVTSLCKQCIKGAPSQPIRLSMAFVPSEDYQSNWHSCQMEKGGIEPFTQNGKMPSKFHWGSRT